MPSSGPVLADEALGDEAGKPPPKFRTKRAAHEVVLLDLPTNASNYCSEDAEVLIG